VFLIRDFSQEATFTLELLECCKWCLQTAWKKEIWLFWNIEPYCLGSATTKNTEQSADFQKASPLVNTLNANFWSNFLLKSDRTGTVYVTRWLWVLGPVTFHTYLCNFLCKCSWNLEIDNSIGIYCGQVMCHLPMASPTTKLIAWNHTLLKKVSPLAPQPWHQHTFTRSRVVTLI